MVKVFVDGVGDRGSIPDQRIKKWYLLYTQHYKVRNKGKWSNPVKEVAPSLSPQCFCYRKRSLRVTLKYHRLTYYHWFQIIWRSRDKLISDVLLWTPSHGRGKARRPAWTYIQQIYEDTGCSPEDLPEAMNDREGWQERVRYICADGTTRWWWSLDWFRH